MSTSITTTELRRMTVSELRKDLFLKRAEAAKTRLGLEMHSEKNHAAYRTMKHDIARMTMVLTELEKNEANKTSEKMEKNDKTASKVEKNAVKCPSSKKSVTKASAKKDVQVSS